MAESRVRISTGRLLSGVLNVYQQTSPRFTPRPQSCSSIDDHPRERRNCVRAAFATVEGHLASLCQQLLDPGGGLSETQRMALRDETYRLTATARFERYPHICRSSSAFGW